jgi:hypothetical protein
MSPKKAFRLIGGPDVEHWQARTGAYGPTEIDEIPNPDGGIAKKAPTSIPSPFARMDLFRNAFRAVAGSKKLTGTTYNHRLVSDCLDLAEIAFNADALKGRVKIKSWDRHHEIELLKKSGNARHQLYGETLDLYFRQDSEANGFERFNKIFIFYCDENIVGGTSPITLFFTTANNLDFIDIRFGEDRVFDKIYKPLYERSHEFQEYLYRLVYNHCGHLARVQADLRSYLEKCMNMFNPANDTPVRNTAFYETLRGITNSGQKTTDADFFAQYDRLDTGSPNDFVQLCGTILGKRLTQNRRLQIAKESAFRILSSKVKYEAGVELPLVLLNEFSLPIPYTDLKTPWNPRTLVPYAPSEPDTKKRMLPDQIDVYPWYTISDFLEPHLFRLPFQVNGTAYFNGNVVLGANDMNNGFLLPVKPLFFNYFSINELLGRGPDNQPMFEIQAYPTFADVYLRIPIMGYNNVPVVITFKRSYNVLRSSGTAAPDENKNEGWISDTNISLALFPPVRLVNQPLDYRIMLIDQDKSLRANPALTFFLENSSEALQEVDSYQRSDKEMMSMNTFFYRIKQQFDYMQLGLGGITGLLVPKFRERQHAGDTYHFAVDFGTTNTHIEYCVNSGPPQPFQIASDVQYATLHDPNSLRDIISHKNIELALLHELMPERIGSESAFRFPQRTAIAYSPDLQKNKPMFVPGHATIPFIYEKVPVLRNTKIITNLKWTKYDFSEEDKRQLGLFLEMLVLLMRNKVLLNGGNLGQSRITWFYPSSMSEERVAGLRKMWDNYYQEHFGTQELTAQHSESLAPYYYFSKKMNVNSADYPAAAIDIGGGTSDFVVYKNNQPVQLSSARFAANALFGDGYGGSPATNGFIIRYRETIRGFLASNELDALLETLQQIEQEDNSAQLISYFFSLEKNKTIRDKKLNLSFSNMLADDAELKLVLLLFYAALLYHLARLMVTAGHKPPRYLIFSGTAAQILNLIDKNSDLRCLRGFTKLLFSKVWNIEIPFDPEIKISPEPKEATAKGGLGITKTMQEDDFKCVLVDSKTPVISTFKSPVRYNQISDETMDDVNNEVNAFIKLVFDLHYDYDYSNKFGIRVKNMEEYSNVLAGETKAFLLTGYNQKLEDIAEAKNHRIDEPLFFYALTGAVHKLATTLITNHS